MSFPSPPFSVSTPAPPSRISLPPRPFSVSLPSRPLIRSSCAVPLIVSPAFVPSITLSTSVTFGLAVVKFSLSMPRMVSRPSDIGFVRPSSPSGRSSSFCG
ncbi:MAG: hypothetical protein EOP18_06905 [Rhizobiaceae bacterium]|nr:MAG: hypothetical protein EOP18_06905 [Rhizobiaceae bacterium]